jgi:hypothetical protein
MSLTRTRTSTATWPSRNGRRPVTVAVVIVLVALGAVLPQVETMLTSAIVLSSLAVAHASVIAVRDLVPRSPHA